MFCYRCGKEVIPGALRCSHCGADVQAAKPRQATLTLTWQEAKKGCVKFLHMAGLAAPLRFELKGGIKNGRVLQVKNARFSLPGGQVVTEPLEVTLLVEKKKKKIFGPILLILAVITAVVLHGMAKDGVFDLPAKSQEELQLEASELIPHFEERYFLSHMQGKDLELALALYDSIMRFEESCKVPSEIRVDRLEDLFMVLQLECPELFQVDFAQDYTYSYDRKTDYVEEVFITYAMNESEYRTKRQAVETVVSALVEQAKDLDDEAKEKLVFDYIAARCYYELEAEDGWNPYGALVAGKAKCDGISLAVKWVLEEMGIECLCVTGDTKNSDIGHAWNIVKLDGEYYALDLTQSVRQEGTAEQIEEEIIYYAYNVTDEWMSVQYVIHDYFDLVAEVPVCDSMENSYYYEHGAFITSQGEIEAVLEKTLSDEINKYGGVAALQFASDSDLAYFIEHIGEYVNDWKSEAGVEDLSAGYILYDVFNVCVIYME